MKSLNKIFTVLLVVMLLAANLNAQVNSDSTSWKTMISSFFTNQSEDLNYNITGISFGISKETKDLIFSLEVPLAKISSTPEKYGRAEKGLLLGIKSTTVLKLHGYDKKASVNPFLSATWLTPVTQKMNAEMSSFGQANGFKDIILLGAGLAYTTTNLTVSAGVNICPYDFGSYSSDNESPLQGDMHQGSHGLLLSLAYRF